MKNIYLKLAISNIKKNRKIYIPYVVMGIVLSFVFYTLREITTNPYIYNAETGEGGFKGAGEIVSIMNVGLIVVAIISLICIFFGNSFVMKQRKRELGLYEILGIRKKGIVKIILWETIFVAGISILLGIGGGIITNKLMLNILFQIVKQEITATMGISLNTVVLVSVVFFCIYLIVYIYNIIQVVRLNLIDILYSNKYGEKEPKVKWFLLSIGCVTLGMGYYLAMNVESTGEAFEVLFPAVILVIVGVYSLFLSGSILVLKLLKQNKHIYYRLSNFISISNLLYRMKQNAIGIASICVLSTAALIIFTAGTALYAGGEKSIDDAYPMDGKIVVESLTKETDERILTITEESANDNKIEITNKIAVVYAEVLWEINDNGFTEFEEWNGKYSSYRDIYIMPITNYNLVSSNEYDLNNDELLICYDGWEKNKTNVNLNGMSFKGMPIKDDTILKYIKDETMTLFSNCLVVVTDDKFEELCNDSNEIWRQLYIGLNIQGVTDTQESFRNNLKESFEANNIHIYNASLKELERIEFLSIYGGVFFVGIYLGVIFIVVTTIIIYYKQISEGYEDRIHYEILKKLGMTHKETNKCIKKQVMMVFFMPLLVAILNMVMALNIIWLFLGLVLKMDFRVFTLCAVIIATVFLASYILVYFITSKTYYKIVYAK